MSYSFAVRGASAAALVALASAELDEVEAAQPIHTRDREAADSAIAKLVSLVAEPGENHELNMSVAGSCYGEPDAPLKGVSLSVHIGPIYVPAQTD